MGNQKTYGMAVLNVADIPRGWVPMSDYKQRGETIYGIVKKAALAGRVESYCLFENGRMRSRPRRWVDPAEVESALLRGREPESPLFAKQEKPTPAPAPAAVDSASVAALVEAVRMLTLEIEAAAAVIVDALARSQPESEPATFGDS